jgi:hypothetical protein
VAVSWPARGAVLSAYLFEDLEQVRQIAWEWMIEYNEERPHDALGKIPPRAFREQPETLVMNGPLDREAYGRSSGRAAWKCCRATLS